MTTDDELLAEVPPGWHAIVREAHAELTAIIPGHEVLQVKEKFGGLRYYAAFPQDATDTERADFRARLGDLELLASSTCEVCGKPGRQTVVHRWYRTLCAEHQQPDVMS